MEMNAQPTNSDQMINNNFNEQITAANDHIMDTMMGPHDGGISSAPQHNENVPMDMAVDVDMSTMIL